MPAARTPRARSVIVARSTSGSPRPRIHRLPSITPSASGAVSALTSVDTFSDGPSRSNSAIDSSSFSFDAGMRGADA